MPEPHPEHSNNDPLHATLRAVAEAVTGERGDDIFRELVYHAALVLGVKYAFIGELAEDDPSKLRMRTGIFNGRFEEDIVYPIKGTPCETVVDQTFRFYPQNVGKKFDSPYIRELAVESYAAIPLFDSDNRAVGLMAVMDRIPLLDKDLIYSTLRVLSVRASIELQRLYAQQESQASKDRYQAIFNKSMDGLILFKPDGQVVDVNPAWLAMHRYARETIVSSTLAPTQFIPKQSYNKFKEFMHHVGSRRVFHTEGEMRRKDGSTFLAEVRGVAIEYRGEPHYLTIVRDVTERREKQQALKRSEDRLRATIGAAMDCIIGMDHNGCVIEFNPAAESVFGYSREQALGKKLADLIIPERYRDDHINGLKRRQGGGSVAHHSKVLGKRVEIAALRADGSEIPVELTIDVAQEDGNEIYFGYVRELTERKRAEREQAQLEAQLRQAQKMEAIGHLSGGIAHDFNNILTSIMGYLVLAQEKGASIQDEKLLHYLERAHNSGLRAKELIQQLLTFSRGQRGSPRTLDLGPVVKESIKLMRSTLPSSIEIVTSVSEKQMPAMLDPVQLEQILLNLCINARDAMDGHGRIEIMTCHSHAVSSVCSSCKKYVAGNFVEMCVIDSGNGIDPKILDRIFEPFFTTKQTGKSSGMGLSTVHGIVHDHGGHIVVESDQAKGARFRVLFPTLRPQRVDEEKQATALHNNSSNDTSLTGHVLIVDDEEQVAEFMGDLFESRGMQSTIITDSEAALRYCRKKLSELDLVITDQTMPKLTGIKLAREIRQLRSDIPIILYSGYSDQITEQEITRTGIDAFLKKPVNVAELIELSRDLLQQQR